MHKSESHNIFIHKRIDTSKYRKVKVDIFKTGNNCLKQKYMFGYDSPERLLS